MTNKEEILKQLFKNLLEERLQRLEKRNLEQMKDLKLEKDAYKKQELLVNKFSTIKIELKKSIQPKKNINRSQMVKSRDKTPNIFSSRRNNSLKKDVKGKRSKTPDLAEKKRRPERKEKMTIKNIKTDKKDVKKSIKNNNNKIPGYMLPIIIDKNKKTDERSSRPMRKAHTPDVKKKNRTSNVNNKKKVNKNIEHNMNNLNKIDLKPEDMKAHITPEDKKEQENLEKKEPKETISFDTILNEAKIINRISSLLDQETRYNFLSCNSKLIKNLKEPLKDSLFTLQLKNGIGESNTVQDQIYSLKLKYKSEEFESEPPKFALAKGPIKAIETLNNENYIQIFNNKELEPPLDIIIPVYRIFFQLLKDNNIKNIKDEKLFWLEASDYILNHSNGKLGEFIKESTENFDFSPKNIYEVKKIIYGNEDKYTKPAFFSKINATTGFVTFMIKDTLEYCGLITSLKKNIPSLCLRYWEYIDEMQNKIQTYIDNINEWSKKSLV